MLGASKESEMPRPQSFDPDTVLDQAMRVFWANGYEATSLDDLVAELGVSRPALYRQWPSKDVLYQAALTRYREVGSGTFLQALQDRPDDTVNVIRERLVEIINETLDDPQHKGCFVVNAICERSNNNESIHDLTDGALATLQDCLTQALTVARERGVHFEHEPVALARYLVVIIQGLRIVGKVRPTLDALDGVIDLALQPLH
jgi:TetR/AcrR family transcriptional regulator, transcriptional repressor for nem operon